MGENMSWNESVIGRTLRRGLIVFVCAGASAVIGYIIDYPKLPIFLTPILVALDKYLREYQAEHS